MSELWVFEDSGFNVIGFRRLRRHTNGHFMFFKMAAIKLGTYEFDYFCGIKSCSMLKYRFMRPDSISLVWDIFDAKLAAMLIIFKMAAINPRDVLL